MIELRQPASIEETGLADSTLEHLILKTLYFKGELYGKDLSDAMGLRFSVIEGLIERLKMERLVQIKRSLGMGNVSALFGLTDGGRIQARECLESNQYWGPAPVPISQYVDFVPKQRLPDGWLTKDSLEQALRGLVIPKSTLAQVGPAVSASKSMLIYGMPGDGKTFLIESLVNLETTPIFIPHAVECQGNIVQVFDPIYHHELAEDANAEFLTDTAAWDRRWHRCKRPFIVTGGELTMDMLDLRFNGTSKVYEAPFQLKANNGMYLIDDFGRQRATPAEVLNRWIVPMERRVDYLTFLTGGKMTVPFETFLVFSTNLNPERLGDEAFLRRISYKMHLNGPTREEFLDIFQRYCAAKELVCPAELATSFFEAHYANTGKAFRRCHPRDVLNHAIDLIHFEKLPYALTPGLLHHAFNTCFVQDAFEAPTAAVPGDRAARSAAA
jgi:predicted ATPase with chaperone activity